MVQTRKYQSNASEDNLKLKLKVIKLAKSINVLYKTEI